MARLAARLSLVLILASASSGLVVGTARAQEPDSVIQGRLYLDLNGNGTFETGDVAVGGFSLAFANGETIQEVVTDEDGLFALRVTPGIWRATPVAPPGISFPEDFSLEVSIPEGEPTEVDLQVAVPLGLLQAWLVSQPDPAELLEAVVQQEPAEVLDSENLQPAPEPQIYTGPIDSLNEGSPPLLLPESGSPLAPAVWLAFGFAGLFLLGLMLILLGRRASSS